jgi:serine protease AprX
MKNALFLPVLLGLFFVGQAQTSEERIVLVKSIKKTETNLLKKNLDQQKKINTKKITSYLSENPDKKRHFVKNGSTYFLQKINRYGTPIYINTKNRESGKLIKADRLYSGGGLGLDISGQNMVVGVWDGGAVRPTHELFSTSENKVKQIDTPTGEGFDDHMNHVTGTIVGGAIENRPEARGIAFNASSYNYDFENDIEEMVEFADAGFLISNHSYGYSNSNEIPDWIFGAYDETSQEWDNLCNHFPNYLPFIAAGNEQQGDDFGNRDKEGYDMMTGASASKNVVTVGAINGDRSMSEYSNWGPTDDGRIKPDVCARGTGIDSAQGTADDAYSGNGEDSSGTSYATPAVTGVATLLQQYYKTINPNYMTAASLKGLLLHTADDAGNEGPDYQFGWGIVNAETAANLITNSTTTSRIIEVTENPANNNSDEYTISFTASGTEKLKVSIVWTDDYGAEQLEEEGIDPTESRLVYNFHPILKNISNDVIYYPWSLGGMENRFAPAERNKPNEVDNFKMIEVDEPVANQEYQLTVTKSTNSPEATKNFSVIISGLIDESLSLISHSKNLNTLTVFPNPTADVIHIISNEGHKPTDFSIYTVTGQLIKKGAISGQQNTINISDLAPGSYLIQLTGNQTNETHQIVKK